MFTSITPAAITTNATAWVSNFDTLLLVAIGIGIGFAVVRFAKSLFF